MKKDDKQKLLIEYLFQLFLKIRSDWHDPKIECQEGYQALGELKKLTFSTGMENDTYFQEVKETLELWIQ